MTDNVFVVSTVNGNVGFSIPELRFKRIWQKKKARFPVPKDVLREAIFNPGVSYLFEKGILYIEDLDFKKEIGLEPYDSVEETIVSVDASTVITSLLNIIQAERVRANNAEATLQHKLNEHENRLKWIELGE